MKAQIRDKRALSSISIASLRFYLKSRDWTDDGPWGGGRATLYLKESRGRDWNMLVPTRDTAGDYAAAMAETLAILADAEDRSQLDIFQDLMGAGADVIRMRSLNGLAAKPLSLRQSADMLRRAYDMLHYAARAVDDPRAAYRGGPNSEVSQYLDSARPMPGYAEGYSLVLHSPVPAEIGARKDLWENDEPLPFARRAAIKLTQALDHADKAAAAAVAEDSLEHFADAVKYGVSANLCDSVAELARKGEGISIGLDWAGIRPAAVETTSFQFSENSAQILAEAGKFFRITQPSYDERVTAHVVVLARKPHEFDGRADMLALRDGRMRKIAVKFGESDYDEAIRAFQERKEIAITGDVHKTAGGYELRNPRDLSVSEDPP